MKYIASYYGYFDLLKRLEFTVEFLDIQNYHQLYPIPMNVLMMNPNIIRNPGY